MTYEEKDLADVVGTFKPGDASVASYSRYASFDYCYNHFHPLNRKSQQNDIEKSCLSLGFYLASWGMFRGSSFLLEKSAKHFEELINYVNSLDPCAWAIDAGCLQQNTEVLNCIYEQIKEKLDIGEKRAHVILVTKIMLGIFGSVPAYDQFFTKSFKEIFKGRCAFTSFTETSLACIDDFYIDNNEKIDKIAYSTIPFKYGGATSKYTKSKIIDMYGFQRGLNKSNSSTE